MTSTQNEQNSAQTSALQHNNQHKNQHIEVLNGPSTARYTAHGIAQELEIGDSTLRTRWFAWISQVAPPELLKEGNKYTELARTLFTDFSKVAKNERDAWVAYAKQKYSHEWGIAGVLEGDLLPAEVGGTLAKISKQNAASDIEITGLKLKLGGLIDQLKEAESDFSDAEIAKFTKRGVKRGLQQFKLETTAQLETVNKLREQLLEDDS